MHMMMLIDIIIIITCWVLRNIAVPNENPQERLMRELREENEKLKKIFEAMQGVASLGEAKRASLGSLGLFFEGCFKG